MRMRDVSYAPVQRLFHPRGAPCILAYSSVTSGSKYATAGRRARLFGRAEKTKAFMGLSALVTNASHSKRLTSAIASVAVAAFMEDQYDHLAAHLQKLVCSTEASKIVVGIAGAPGSGKSTTAREVCRRLNAGAAQELAVVVPMDGFHYPKARLQQFEDPQAAFARRGAPWTFDAQAFVDCVRSIRELGDAEVPSFDHGVGDPVQGDIRVLPSHRVVLVEGNYLLLDEPPWSQLLPLFDETWYVECDVDEAMSRVFARQTGHGVAPEVSRGRISGNDRPNAELVARTSARAERLVPSLPFKHEIAEE